MEGAECAEKNNSYLPGDNGKYKTSEQIAKVYDRHSRGLSGVVVNEALEASNPVFSNSLRF